MSDKFNEIGADSDEELGKDGRRKRVLSSTTTEDMSTPQPYLIRKAVIEPKTECSEGSLQFKKNHTNLQFGEKGSSDEFEDISKVKEKVENIMKAHKAIVEEKEEKMR